MDDNDMAREATQKVKEELKKQAKKKTRKIIMTIVKAVVIPMLLFILKILSIILAIIIIVSLMNSIFDLSGGGGGKEDEDYAPSTEMSVDITNEELILSEDKIEEFIKNYKTDNEKLKEEMLDNIDRIKRWQDDYGYSGTILVAIAFEDNVESFDEFLTEMQKYGQSWKENGYTNISEIAEDYIDDDTAQEWANNITNKINETAIDSEIIQTGQEDLVAGDGYDSTYVSKAGKTYYNLKQNKPSSYSDYVWVKGSTNTIAYNGCALVSATIIIDGYLGVQKTPKQVVQEMSGGYFESAPSPVNYLTKYGISASRPYAYNKTELTSSQKQEILDNLLENRPVIIKVTKAAGSDFPYGEYGEHWMALLDYDQVNQRVYLSNPSYGGSPYGDEGWISKDRVLRGCVEFIPVLN